MVKKKVTTVRAWQTNQNAVYMQTAAVYYPAYLRTVTRATGREYR